MRYSVYALTVYNIAITATRAQLSTNEIYAINISKHHLYGLWMPTDT